MLGNVALRRPTFQVLTVNHARNLLGSDSEKVDPEIFGNQIAEMAAFNQVHELADKIGIGSREIEQIDRIGILHASAIYERWCLVRLISLLIDTFDFTPEHDWLDCVIKKACGALSPFELRFYPADVGMIARLEVQPVLPNGRRPDFRLIFQQHDENRAEAANSDVSEVVNAEPSTGLILDAKFRTHWRPGELDRVLHDIAEARGYSQAARRVLILQPAGPVVRESKSIVAELSCEAGYPLSPLGSCHAFDLGGAECVEAVHQCHTDVDFGGLAVRVS